MNNDSLSKAIREAERFVAMARNLRGAVNSEFVSPSKEAATVKRASMDLTRALAEMRKPS